MNKTYILIAILVILAIAVISILAIHCYFIHKAKKMTDRQLVKGKIQAWFRSGWLQGLKYEAYSKVYSSRRREIPYSDPD